MLAAENNDLATLNRLRQMGRKVNVGLMAMDYVSNAGAARPLAIVELLVEMSCTVPWREIEALLMGGQWKVRADVRDYLTNRLGQGAVKRRAQERDERAARRRLLNTQIAFYGFQGSPTN